jgi:ubiquinone/menaquinone biosynthesis C-methylase UbiE
MTAITPSRSAAYDDPDYNYLDYWSGRGYEHEAEVMAIRRLLKGHRFGRAVDVGGGYGRLSVVFAEYADKITLTDSSDQQLGLADRYLADYPEIDRRLMEAHRLRFADASVDLVTLVRVLHHLPDPSAEIRELSRILRPGGYAIIEVANVTHALNRLRYLVRREKIPLTAVEVLPEQARQQSSIPFVNHHPQVMARQFAAAGLQIERVLSVSNFRHPLLKAAIPQQVMLAAERFAQERLGRAHFGPSSFYLLQKEGR